MCSASPAIIASCCVGARLNAPPCAYRWRSRSRGKSTSGTRSTPRFQSTGHAGPVSFRPPSERLEGNRIHEWLGARKRLLQRSLRREGTDGKRMRRQQIFLRVLIEQHFDFLSLLADPEAVQVSGEEALRELAMIDPSWRMKTFEHVRDAMINGMCVQLKENEPVTKLAKSSRACRRPLRQAIGQRASLGRYGKPATPGISKRRRLPQRVSLVRRWVEHFEPAAPAPVL